jgi:GntR family transcriptional regulator
MDSSALSIKPDHRPLYDRAVEALHCYLAQGGFQPGDRLPGESELARQLGISRPTLREAMGALELQGVISRRHGVGAFVTMPVHGAMYDGLERLESMASMAAKAAIHIERAAWEVETAAAGDEAAAALEVAPGAPLIRVQATIAKIHSPLDGESGGSRYLAHLDSYVRPEYADLDELRAFSGGSLLDYLLLHPRARLSYTDTHLFAVHPNGQAAQRLHAAHDQPLLLLVETFYTDAGAPVAWTRNYFITEEVNFQITRHIIHHR